MSTQNPVGSRGLGFGRGDCTDLAGPPAANRTLDTVRHLTAAYLALCVATVAAIVLLRSDHAAVNSAVWTRGTIVALSALLTFALATRAQRGSARALLRLRIITAVMIVAIAVIISLPGTFPLWMKLEQAVCGLLLIAVATLVNRRSVRQLLTS